MPLKRFSRTTASLLTLTLSLALIGSPRARAASNSNFIPYNYNYLNDGSIEMMGKLHVPANYDPTKKYSLVVYYHGSGSPGSDNSKPVNEMNDHLYNALVARDAFIYAPQLPGAIGANTWNGSAIDNSMRTIARAAKEYNIDLNQLYVTGYSLGGGGSWIATSRYHGVVAATAPGAGHLSVAETRPEYLVDKPIWAFHASNDGTVNVGQSRAMINAIQAAQGKPAVNFPLTNSAPYYTTGSGTTYFQDGNLRYTEYNNGDHGIGSKMYTDPNLFDWMYSHSGSGAPKAGQKLHFDFGNTGASTPRGSAGDGRMLDSQGKAWNSISNWDHYKHVGTLMAFAVDEQGHNTTVILDTVRAFGGFKNGALAGNGMDASIGNDSWLTLINASSTENYSELLLRGLTPGGLYDLSIFAASNESDGGLGFMTRYEVNGIFRDLQAARNISEWAEFESLVADASGYLSLKIYVTPGSGSQYGMINTMTLTAVVPEPGTCAMVIFGLVLAVTRCPRHRAS